MSGSQLDDFAATCSIRGLEEWLKTVWPCSRPEQVSNPARRNPLLHRFNERLSCRPGAQRRARIQAVPIAATECCGHVQLKHQYKLRWPLRSEIRPTRPGRRTFESGLVPMTDSVQPIQAMTAELPNRCGSLHRTESENPIIPLWSSEARRDGLQCALQHSRASLRYFRAVPGNHRCFGSWVLPLAPRSMLSRCRSISCSCGHASRLSCSLSAQFWAGAPMVLATTSSLSRGGGGTDRVSQQVSEGAARDIRS